LVPDPLLMITYNFKVSVLVPLEWGNQTLSCFGFSTYSYTSHMCSPLVLWSKSNHIAAFALDLKSAYEGEHMIYNSSTSIISRELWILVCFFDYVLFTLSIFYYLCIILYIYLYYVFQLLLKQIEADWVIYAYEKM
jgi:hypothetical protein